MRASIRVTDLGLGACWCGAHPQKRVEDNIRKCLGIPEKQIPLNIIFIGYPAEEQPPRTQYDESKIHYVKQMIKYEKLDYKIRLFCFFLFLLIKYFFLKLFSPF